LAVRSAETISSRTTCKKTPRVSRRGLRGLLVVVWRAAAERPAPIQATFLYPVPASGSAGVRRLRATMLSHLIPRPIVRGKRPCSTPANRGEQSCHAALGQIACCGGQCGDFLDLFPRASRRVGARFANNVAGAGMSAQIFSSRPLPVDLESGFVGRPGGKIQSFRRRNGLEKCSSSVFQKRRAGGPCRPFPSRMASCGSRAEPQ